MVAAITALIILLLIAGLVIGFFALAIIVGVIRSEIDE